MNGLKDAPMTSPAAGPAARASTVTVLLVDDHPLVRDGVAHLLTDGGFNVVGQASSLAEGMRLADAVRADVMVVDVSLGDGSGLDLVTAVRTKRPAMGIVVLTMHDDDETLLAALDAGASSLVLKTSSSEEVLAMVRRAADCAPLVHRGRPGRSPSSAVQRRPPNLTAREMEVLERLAVGDSVAGMAKRLYMSESTAKTHIAKLYSETRRPQPGQRGHGRDQAGVRQVAALRRPPPPVGGHGVVGVGSCPLTASTALRMGALRAGTTATMTAATRATRRAYSVAVAPRSRCVTPARSLVSAVGMSGSLPALRRPVRRGPAVMLTPRLCRLGRRPASTETSVLPGCSEGVQVGRST